MALDPQSSLRSAEALFGQGKVQAAISELARLAKSAPGDLLTLNRVGDLLARQGQTEEAIGYYVRIADEFTGQGFYPKAVAIYKKVLRLDPQSPDAMLWLGDLYLKQKLPGEARGYFLRAAEQFLENKEFDRARETYERLVAAEPSDPRHRARLAETRAAEGDRETAGTELLELARFLLTTGRPADAERSYRRAAELIPERPEPRIGIANCLTEVGREDEALRLLEEAARDGRAAPALLGELGLRYELSGQHEQALSLFERPEAAEIPDGVFLRIFEYNLRQGQDDELWTRIEPIFEQWTKGDRAARLADLLLALASLEAEGYLPALQRLVDLRRAAKNTTAIVDAVERLVEASRARSMTDEVEPLLEELERLAPDSTRVAADAAEPAPLDEPITETAPPAPVVPQASEEPAEAEPEMPVQAEAPAVPLTATDEEQVAGKLTQSEILEKYGLEEQAIDQVREVVGKFPGHVPAQQRLVALLRSEPDRSVLPPALVGPALAQRAAGNTDAAREAAREAEEKGGLDEDALALFRRLELIDPPEASAPAAPREIPSVRPAAVPSHSRPVDSAVVIDLDAMEDEPEAESDEPQPSAPAPPTPQPADAPAPVVAAPSAESVPVTEEAAVTPDLTAVDEDDDLSAITAALESELFSEEPPVERADPESEQSLSEVFAAFKQHVDEEVGSDDYRTHYDLGIAYKEMGLMDEAMGEFRIALKSTEIFCEASVMLAVCHRERGEIDEAANRYREALEAVGADVQAASGLRYDLAEVLLQSGDREAALGLFRDVLQADPQFRDVQARIAELESASAG
jgi:tetratricopeptide (TPR) repeat protein